MHDCCVFVEMLKSLGCPTLGMEEIAEKVKTSHTLPPTHLRRKLLVDSIFTTQILLQHLMNNPNFLAVRMAHQDYKNDFKSLLSALQNHSSLLIEGPEFYISKVLFYTFEMIAGHALMYKEAILKIKHYEDLPVPLDTLIPITPYIEDIPEETLSHLGIQNAPCLKELLIKNLNSLTLFIPIGLESPKGLEWVNVEEVIVDADPHYKSYKISHPQYGYYTDRIPVTTMGSVPDVYILRTPRWSNSEFFSLCSPLDILFLFRTEEWASFTESVIWSVV